MMNWDIQRFFTLFITAVFFVGCHFFDDPDESFDESDDDCPLNSGYPCACDPKEDLVRTTGLCLDGSYCIAGVKNPGMGFCSQRCVGWNDSDSCILPFSKWGVGFGLCFVDVFQVAGEANGCVLVCEANLGDNEYGIEGTLSGECPWGLECQELLDPSTKVCAVPHSFDY